MTKITPEQFEAMNIGIDRGSPDGDETAISLRASNQVHIIPEPFASALLNHLDALQSAAQPEPQAREDVHPSGLLQNSSMGRRMVIKEQPEPQAVREVGDRANALAEFENSLIKFKGDDVFNVHLLDLETIETIRHALSTPAPEPAEGLGMFQSPPENLKCTNEAIRDFEQAIKDAVYPFNYMTDRVLRAAKAYVSGVRPNAPHPAKIGDKVCAEGDYPECPKCGLGLFTDNIFGTPKDCNMDSCPMKPTSPLCDHPASLPHLSENLGTLKGVPAEKLTGLKNRIAEYRAEMLDHFGEPVKGVKFREIEMLQYLELFAASPAAMEKEKS